jgi:hypothetical protein
VHFLLSLIEPQAAAAVRQRLGMAPPQQYADDRAMRELDRRKPPRSVLLWMLECDDPATNRLIFHHDDVPDAIKRDIMRGVPFGTATGPLQVLARCGRLSCSHEAPHVPVSEHGMVGGLREARKMGPARTAARAVGRDDWATVAEVDRVEPLPGYARWALAERIDCPPQLRAQFGSHPKFTHRLRTSGIVELREYVELSRIPQRVLEVLYFGAALFPHRAAEAAALLTPLVRAELGANLDAWAVLAQLLPTFAGTVPELVATSGAIAGV